MTIIDTSSDTIQSLISRAHKASTAIFIAVEEAVAEDISGIIKGLLAERDRLLERCGRLEGALDEIHYFAKNQQIFQVFRIARAALKNCADDSAAHAVEPIADWCQSCSSKPAECDCPSPQLVFTGRRSKRAALAPAQGGQQEHVCGKQGFGRGADGINDRCAKCEQESGNG